MIFSAVYLLVRCLLSCLMLLAQGGQVDASTLKSSKRPCGTRSIGVDKGYTEALTDSDGQHYGTDFGPLLTAQSDLRKRKGQARAKPRVVSDRAIEAGDRTKAGQIERNNLGTAKRDRQAARWRTLVRNITYQAVNDVVDKAGVVVAEDLTKPFTGGLQPTHWAESETSRHLCARAHKFEGSRWPCRRALSRSRCQEDLLACRCGCRTAAAARGCC